MFKKLLLPISSENLSKKAIDKTRDLTKEFNCDIKVLYIIEKKMINKINRACEYIRTEKQIEELECEIEDALKEEFDTFFDKWKEELNNSKNINTKVVTGEYSEEVKKEINNFKPDLIIIEIKKKTMVKYHIIYERTDIPILIVR